MIIKTFGSFYTNDPASLGKAERRAVELLIEKIKSESHYASNLVVNLTWFWYRDEKFVEDFISWVNENAVTNSTRIYFTSFIDLVDGIRTSQAMDKIISLGYDISFHGFGEDWYSIFPSWLKQYQDNEILLTPTPKWAFLSYNRKPTDHRIDLVAKLVDKNLHKHGWITFQTGYFAEIDEASHNSDFALYPVKDGVEYLYEPLHDLSRPEDIKTIGNLDIWNNSYCVIVSETSKNDKWHISEKTWKPILGLRPYLLNGSPSVIGILQNFGFYSPGDLFENKNLDTCQTEVLVEFIEYLSSKTPDELFDMWTKQRKMLDHNRQRFQELAIKWNFAD